MAGTVYVVNPRTTPVVVDEEGHILAGGEQGDVEDTPRNQHSVLVGALQLLDRPASPTPAPAAPAAPVEQPKGDV